jgi:hypothetical protein
MSLVELTMAAAISVIPIYAVWILLVGGQRGWDKTFYLANRQIKADAEAAAVVFGAVGRKSDRCNCVILTSGAGSTAVIAQAAGDGVARGEAVEFRYFDEKNRGRSQRSTPNLEGPTEYARFYLDKNDSTLKVDYGPYSSGTTGRKVTSTAVLARNVTRIQFSQQTVNSVGQNCVRMSLTVTDPVDGKGLTVRAATLMRN